MSADARLPRPSALHCTVLYCRLKQEVRASIRDKVASAHPAPCPGRSQTPAGSSCPPSCPSILTGKVVTVRIYPGSVLGPDFIGSTGPQGTGPSF